MEPDSRFPWGDTRRFYSYSRYIRNLFGERVQKLTLDAGLSCPNRSSRHGPGGCTYCNNAAFNPSYCMPEKTIRRQLEEGMQFHQNRYRRAHRYLAYFQAYTNTFAPLAQLRELFREALAPPEVVGVVVGTRPDCLPPGVVALLQEVAQTHRVIVEIGVESLHETTLCRVRRGHSAQASLDAIGTLHAAGLQVGVHLILGLPGEGEEEMIGTLERLMPLPISSVKFHQLQVLEGTRMAEEWQRRPNDFALFSLEGYLAFLRGLVERMPPRIAVERICAESPPRFLLAPNWGTLRNDQVLARFERELAAHDSWQGKRLGVPRGGGLKAEVQPEV